MSKASVLNLVQTFALGDADPITAEQYYDHLMDDTGRAPWFVAASLVTMVTGTSTYALADDQIKILGMVYDDRWLDRMDHRALESFNPSWRDEKGLPVAYSIEDEATKTFRLYPTPDRPSGNFIFVYGSPLGLDYPPYAVLLFHTQLTPDALEFMELPLMWDVLAREFGHESNHRDDDYADFAQQLADVLWRMIS